MKLKVKHLRDVANMVVKVAVRTLRRLLCRNYDRLCHDLVH